jgi:hypothetical protein
MATKTVHVHSHDAKTNLQIIKDSINGVPLFEPHEKQADRVRPPDGTALEVVSTTVKGSGLSNPEYYYITDSPSNGNFRRYYIKKEDVS